MAVQLQRRLLTVEDYHLLIRAGSLGEDDRLELIEGEIIEMSPISPEHAARVKRLNRLFAHLLGKRALISVQDPIQLHAHSEPQPDLALLRLRDDDYAESHPGPNDVLLVVEVAETSASYDRDVKMPLYARAGIPEAWLVSLADQWIEVHQEPSPAGYLSMRKALPGSSVAPQALPDAALAVSEILG
ncbi:MAG TPA: Uma2 family endonuclease [Anaerolineae bacterium]